MAEILLRLPPELQEKTLFNNSINDVFSVCESTDVKVCQSVSFWQAYFKENYDRSVQLAESDINQEQLNSIDEFLQDYQKNPGAVISLARFASPEFYKSITGEIDAPYIFHSRFLFYKIVLIL